MSPEYLRLLLFGLREAIIFAPKLKQSIAELCSKEEPTKEDWDNLIADIDASSYEVLVPETALIDIRTGNVPPRPFRSNS